MKARLRFLAACCTAIFSSAAVMLAICLGSPSVAYAQKEFKSPEEAMTSFGNAVANNDEATPKGLAGR